MLIIGDVHGKTDEYKKIIFNYNKPTIQLGDFGFRRHHQWHTDNIDSTKHKINFGNHDDTTFLKYPHSLGNYSYDEASGIFTMRGAFSVDRINRTEGVDWFADEELNYAEILEAVDCYNANKPKIVVTHDCPHEIRRMLFGIEQKSITCNGLQSMFESHKPDLWFFGHHHQSLTKTILGTKFICLNELETYEI